MAEERRESDDDIEQVEGRLGGYAATYEDTAVVPFPGDIRTAALSALWAGPVAGLAMGVVMMKLYGLIGFGFWLPLRLIAVPIFGPEAIIAGPGAVIVGLALHLVVATILAVVFAIVLVSLLGRVGPWIGGISGVLYGLAVWVAAQFVVLPVTYPLLATALLPWAFGLSHVVYGLVLGLLPTNYKVTREEYEAARSSLP